MGRDREEVLGGGGGVYAGECEVNCGRLWLTVLVQRDITVKTDSDISSRRYGPNNFANAEKEHMGSAL